MRTYQLSQIMRLNVHPWNIFLSNGIVASVSLLGHRRSPIDTLRVYVISREAESKSHAEWAMRSLQ